MNKIVKDLNDLHSKKFLIDREMRHLKSEGEALKSVLSDYRSQADEKAKLLREIEKVKTHKIVNATKFNFLL